ncbi:cytochrome c oxidase subunit II [Crenobacter sp. SG2305]|uniref:cytochrome c oxidase subunit II n=1 Tax=Crenobacter oryzisoli TaxID=3056844 RepID=UPI0025AA45F5|nr:cytochrome c oxidase subunit II [Crenobacter sp. SG2305]MDN0084302.1 cytochrome c oxidase subunit II [Crenobacter sp. SG2305]
MSFLRFFTVMLGMLATSAEAAEVNLQSPVTSIARDIYGLHTLLLIITGTIALVVFGVMFYAIIRHRKAAGRTAKLFHENTTVEVIWTVVPFLILVGMAWPATRTVLAQKSTRGEDMTIKVTGYQWKWRYDYLDDNFGFVSHLATPQSAIQGVSAKPVNYLLEVDEPLVVPTGKKVRLLLTANDVIHSWWMPALGVKQDAIPGFVRDTWFKVDTPGTYRGQCSELCGKDHGYMPIVVIAKSPADYDKWLADKKKAVAAMADDPNKIWKLEDLKARGEKVYQQNCVPCHQATGKGIPGSFPALDGSKIVTTDKAAHIHIVLNGSQKNPAMAAWGKQLSDTDIAAVITYERNAWSNHTGDVIQPKDVKAARGGKV